MLLSPHMSAIYIHIAVQFHDKEKYSHTTITTCQPSISAIYIHIALQFHARKIYSQPIIATSVSRLYPHSSAIPCHGVILTAYYSHICQPSVFTRWSKSTSDGNTHFLLSPHLSAICIHKALQFHVKGKYSHTIIAHLSAICIHIAVQFYFKRKYSLAIIATYVSHLYSNSGATPCQREILTSYYRHICQASVST